MKIIPAILIVLLFSISLAQATIKERLDHCATITQAIERLVCFDALHSTVQNEVPTPVDVDKLTTTGLEAFGFEFVSYDFTKTSLGYTELIAELKNNTDTAQTVKLEVIARDENGKLVDAEEFVATAFINIEPGQTRGVKHTVSRSEEAVSFDLKILESHTW